MYLWILFSFLITGLLTGYSGIYSGRLLRLADQTVEVSLIFLLASMGAKIGIDREVLGKINTIGLQAFTVSTGSIIGSIVLVKLFSNLVSGRSVRVPDSRRDKGFSVSENNKEFYLHKQGNREITEEEPWNFETCKRGEGLGRENQEMTEPVEGQRELSEQGHRVMTIKILISVIGGIIVGFFLASSYLSLLDLISTSALALLFLGIGVEIGGNKEIFQQIRILGWKIILLPFLVAVGSILGAVIAGFFLGLDPNQTAAVGAGFGWYSLSGVLLSKIHSVELGSIAFLANVFRELASILILPFVVKYLGNLTGIAPGGATTMDSTLPVIKKVAGAEMVVPAFISGAVLTALVPILVPLLIKL